MNRPRYVTTVHWQARSHLSDGQTDGEAFSWDDPLELQDDEDEGADGKDDDGDAKPKPEASEDDDHPPPKPRKPATGKKGAGKPATKKGKGKVNKKREEVVDIEDDDEDGEPNGDDSELEFDQATKKTGAKGKKLPPLPKRRRRRPPPPPPPPPKPGPKPQPSKSQLKGERQKKDPDKFARNLELGGFHVRREHARVVVVDGDKYTTSKITKRSNLINGIVDHLHFAHLDLWGTTGEVKKGALIFINTNERRWLTKELCHCNHKRTTAAGEKDLCAVPPSRCRGERFLLGQLPCFFGDMTSHVASSILC